MTRIEIDLNVRVRGNGTRVGFEDVEGPMAVGMKVQVYESETGLAGAGSVTEIDLVKRLVFLSVDWASLREQPVVEDGQQTEEQLGQLLRLRRSGRLASGPGRPLRYRPANGMIDGQPDFHDGRLASKTELVVAAL